MAGYTPRRADYGKVHRGKYVVGAASIWFTDENGETRRAEPEEVVGLDVKQAKHFRSNLRPYIPEEEELEEDLDPVPARPAPPPADATP